MPLKYFSVIAMVLLATACTKEADYISTIPASENPYLIAIDSFSATATVYRPDSIATSGKSSFLIGAHKDAVFGAIQCSPYFRITAPSQIPELGSNSYFDSIVLVMRTNGMWYGDTNSTIGMGVYRLQEDMTTSDSYFYSHQKFQHYNDALGTVSLVLRPHVNDTVSIKLTAELGKELFDFCKQQTSYVTDNTTFQTYFKGLAIMPAAGSNAIYGFSNSDSAIQMRIYYHNDNGRNEPQQFAFGIDNSSYSFYHMDVDRSGTPLAALDNAVSTPSNGLILNNEITGVRTRINFPYLSEILKTGSTVKLLQARMEIKPVATRYYTSYQLPPTLNVYYYPVSAELIGPMPYTDGSNETQTGDLVIDNNFGKDTRWTFDVTSFVNSEVSANNYDHLELVFTNPNSASDLSSLVAGMPSTTYSSRLIITSLVYNNQ